MKVSAALDGAGDFNAALFLCKRVHAAAKPAAASFHKAVAPPRLNAFRGQFVEPAHDVFDALQKALAPNRARVLYSREAGEAQP